MMMVDTYRQSEERFDRRLNRMKSHFDQQDKKLDEPMEKTRETNQRLAGLEIKLSSHFSPWRQT